MRTTNASNSNMNSFSSNARVALAMQKFGIQMIVKTTQGEIEGFTEQFLLHADNGWGNGRDNSQLFADLKAKLLREDRYFNKHPNRATKSNQRWADFCEGCVILAVLNQVVHGSPIMLVHPTQYAEHIKRALVVATDGSPPDYINAPFMH